MMTDLVALAAPAVVEHVASSGKEVTTIHLGPIIIKMFLIIVAQMVIIRIAGR